MVFKGQIGVEEPTEPRKGRTEETVAIVERKEVSPIKYNCRHVTAGFGDKETMSMRA